VLVIEDGDDNRRMLASLLEHRGFRVHQAATGEDGLEAVLRLRPGRVLLDIGLPGIDGHEVARRLREQLGDATPPLIALTGYGQPADRDRAREAGFDAFLVKPVTMEQLTTVLERS
jgi:CheY-like chemotaxis protein